MKNLETIKKNSFLRRIVLNYIVIVIIPLFLIFAGITYFLLLRQSQQVRSSEQFIFEENITKLKDAIKTFDLIESIIVSDSELILFLAKPENTEENVLIQTILNKTLFFEQISTITPDIYGIRIFANNPKILERWPTLLNSSRINGEKKERWNFDYQALFLGNQNSLQYQSFCTTREIKKGPLKLGYIQISYKMDTIFPYLYNFDDTVNSYLITKVNEDFQNFTVIKKSFSYEKNQLEQKEIKKLTKIFYNSQKSEKLKGNVNFGALKKFICWEFIPDLDSYLIQISSTEFLRSNFMIITAFTVLILCLFLVVLYFVIKHTTFRLMSGIYSVMDGMQEVKNGNISVQIPINGIDEVTETQIIFNSMTKQLSSQMELIKTEQNLIINTEIKAMQNQINAHFLYNVLETIRMQAVLANQEDIAESLWILGKMLRYCLRWRVPKVSLSQEIEYIQSYIYILNIRNDYIISLDIDIPENLMKTEIPKMTLQPLIENSFIHSIEKEEKNALLKVFAKLSEDKSKVILSVQDFGCGMDEKQVNNIRAYLNDDNCEYDKKSSIGLKNIQQRLTVFYGKDYRIKIESKVGKGTVVSVPIPNKKLNSDEQVYDQNCDCR